MDQTTFHKLATAELDAVYRFAYHLSGSSNEAGDLVQETYLRALKSSGSFKLAEYGIRPWLFKILQNVLRSRASKSQRDREAIAELQLQRMSEPQPEPVETETNWENVDEHLKGAIDDLPMAHRACFLLWAVEGLKYREIADITEVPIGTVMSRLSRARAMLHERLRNRHGGDAARRVAIDPAAKGGRTHG